VLTTRCNDLTVPYPTGSISAHDPFVDHLTNHIDIHTDENGCVSKYALPEVPQVPKGAERMGKEQGVEVYVDEDWKQRVVARKERFEKERHRLPPFVVLPLPGPLKHVSDERWWFCQWYSC
jgi:hypothetical protein